MSARSAQIFKKYSVELIDEKDHERMQDFVILILFG